ncbi:diguanylate cyclase (GGDEF)-like protein [Microvirga flocculans]|uniref:diguanylate cyclase n=1 Tax=Microvirga flocculans TaxID=217168 RepID=A0A7W6IEZ0_9HYPH|nr:GGDEF domain-containing protein [Microvirga flocculans]MBB4039655.1 diguanylate cyclase (GGDEF)-like protein [Microvirga flocculans]
MVLDPATLTVAFLLLSAVLGTLLILSGLQPPKMNPMIWWGSSFWLLTVSVGWANLGRGQPSYTVLLLANTLTISSYGALYVGCRIFNNRSGIFLPLLTGAIVWIAVFPFIFDSLGYRVILVSIVTGVYSALSAWELGRRREQTLTSSQRIVVLLLACLSFFSFLRALLGFSVTSVAWIDSFARRWSSELALFLVVFGPALAFMLLSMTKERLKLEYKNAALIDSLTGIANRRAFFQNASILLDRLGGKPASCLLFDLDNFKAINDRHGHDAGDRILSLFARILEEHMPKNTFGRLGGEEFAAVLAVGSQEAAVLAERIRDAFAQAGGAVLGSDQEVTVSAGCATASGATVEALLQRADRALYRAKERGRNLVVAA